MAPAQLPEWVPRRRRVIGENIRTRRRERELTQESLAERAGLDRKTINRIEQGHMSPVLDHLLLIADALGTPLSQLVRD